MFLSIIIPTWRNTEAELIRCMDSIYQSTWRDFEVLVVDDGNEAAYGAMLDELTRRYPITVIHAPHGGVSAARNLAVTHARGDYVLFVDADDVVTRQFWRDTEGIRAQGMDFDIIYGMVSDKKEVPLSEAVRDGFDGWQLDEKERRELYGHMFALRRRRYHVEGGRVRRGPWARLIRRDFLKKFPFDTSLSIGEDAVWNLAMLKADPAGWVMTHVWYYVIGNPDSATRGYRKDRIERVATTLFRMQDYVTSDTVQDYQASIFESLGDIGRLYFLSPKNPQPWFQKVKEFNQMAKSAPFNKVLEFDVKMGG